MSNSLYQSFIDGIKADPVLTVWEWADKNRYLTSETAAMPGLYRTDVVPYAREIMACLSVNNPARRIVVQKGAQLGLSEVGNNWIGYIIDAVPGPTLCVQPTIIAASNYSTLRIDTLIKHSPALVNKVQEAKARESGNTKLNKSFKGGFLAIVSGNSASSLRSLPIKNLFLDEVDGYPIDIPKEGSPVDLAITRTSTFQQKKKIYEISTPLVEGSSRICADYELSSKEKYFVPCPLCGEFQTLEFSQLRYDVEKYEQSTVYECIHCKGLIEEWHKPEMLNAGKWVAEHPDRDTFRGFFISTMYAPFGWFGWWEMAKDYEAAKLDNTKMKTFVNTKLGLAWRESGETPNHDRLYERRENYQPGMLPLGASLIVGGVDVQANRLEIMLVAFNRRQEKWLVEYKVIIGDVESDEVWDEAFEYMNTEFSVFGSKIRIPITAFCIDAGYANIRVAAFAKRFARNKCFMIKGTPNGVTLLSKPRDMEIKQNGKSVKTGQKIWNIYPDVAKGELFRHLMLPSPEDGQAFPNGYFHFHMNTDMDFFKGLCSEELRTKIVNGFPVYYYFKTYRRNEQLDCAVYGRTCFAILGADRWDSETWDAIDDNLKISDDEIEKDVRRFHNIALEASLAPVIEAVPVSSTPEERRVEVLQVQKNPPPVRGRRKSSFF